MATVLSALTSYLSVAEFLKRVDNRAVGQLASDTDVPITSGSLATNTNVLTAIGDACGMLEAAALKGRRYAHADLTTLSTTDCMSQRLLLRILSDLAWVLLWERRPNKQLQPPPSLDRTLAFLDMIAKGERIFGFQDNVDAGFLDTETMNHADNINRNGVVYQARRFFGKRAIDDK